MPYRGHYNENYENFFKVAIQDASLEPVLAAHLVGPRVIIQDVWEQTKSAFVVLADLTGKNPNVFYELGLAHAAEGTGEPGLKREITASLNNVLKDPGSARGYLFSEAHKPNPSVSFQDYIAQFPIHFGDEDALLERSEFAEIRETLGDHGRVLIRYLRGGNVDGAQGYLRKFGFSEIKRDHLVQTVISALKYLPSILPGAIVANKQSLGRRYTR